MVTLRLCACVLVADPDPNASLLYASALKIPVHRVTQALDGRDAIVKAFSTPVSLFITETCLPHIDGYSLCEILRGDRATQELPVLVIAADGDAETLSRAVDAGADGVIVRPFEADLVLTEAQRLLCGSGKRRVRPSTLPAGTGRARTDGARQPSVRQRTKSREHARFETTDPPIPPPLLRCPLCDDMLSYISTQIGGVSEAFPEQWDYYACRRRCSRFQYRHRSRTLRALKAGGV